MFAYTIDNKRYHTLNYHLIKTFGEKVYKAVIDAGFSCPNIDGTVGESGCAYCISGASEFTNDSRFSITEQLEKERERISQKHKNPKLIAYFQAHTNTYADIKTLKKKYDEALNFPDVVGLSIATRPDCIDEDIADMLSEYKYKTYLTVELGLQTVNDKTAEKFNRGYNYDTFLSAYNMLKSRNIRVCVHIINGLLGETKDDMINTAKTVGKLKPDAVKIHLLHILRGTQYEKEYKTKNLIPMTKDAYINTVIRQLEYLPDTTVIERITGDGSKENLVAPLWSLDKISVLGSIDKEMDIMNTYQGIFFY